MTTIPISAWLKLLQEERPLPRLLQKGPLPLQEDAAHHTALYQRAPSLYALSAMADGVTRGQALRILYHLLQSSRAGLSLEDRSVVEQVTERLLLALPGDEIITLFLVLKRVRANHKHVRRAMVRFLLNHPERKDLWAYRGRAVIECFEHALGGPVFRGCKEAILAEKSSLEQDRYLTRYLFKYVQSPHERTRAWLKHLLLGDKAKAPPRQKPEARKEALAAPVFPVTETRERPRTITATNRGDISATLVHLYRGGKSPELTEALEKYIAQAAEKVPAFDGKLALVLDASASTRGYGEREYCCISQSVALRMVLEKRCPKLELWMVGGQSDPPVPQGETDLATAVLDAVEGDPDLVVIVSDGYENAEHGDLEQVLASLPNVGVSTPIVFCHSKFTHKDALDLRRPVRNALEVSFWHEDDFAPLCRQLFSMARGEAGLGFLRQNLQSRLA